MPNTLQVCEREPLQPSERAAATATQKNCSETTKTPHARSPDQETTILHTNSHETDHVELLIIATL